jgi:hypothetical protein
MEWDQMQQDADAQYLKKQTQHQRQPQQQHAQADASALSPPPPAAGPYGTYAPRRGSGGGGSGAVRSNPLYRASSLQSSVQATSPSARSGSGLRHHVRVLRRVAALPQDASKLLWFGKPRLMLLVSGFSRRRCGIMQPM